MTHLIRITVIPILLIGTTLFFTSCKAKPTMAVVTTTNVTDKTQTTATSGGNVTSDGNAEVTSRGVCWSTSVNPTIGNNKTSDGSGTGSFTSSLTQLTPGTTYYVKAYATNSEGTAYGSQVSFSSNPVILATLSTASPTLVTGTTAVSGGTISSDGGGSITAKGVCWSKTANPTINNDKTNDGTGTGSFTSNLTGLSPTTVYYLRAYATNSAGTAYGDELSFSTTGYLASLITYNVEHISQWSAFVANEIGWDGGAAITARGVCWGTSQNPDIEGNKTDDGSGAGYFYSSLINLSPGTTYYIRAYAVNSAGTAYGDQINFTTLPGGPVILNPDLTYGTITDIEGNLYRTIQIGTQVWMAENLRTTKLNNNTDILLVTDDTEWSSITSPAFCWYGNNSTVFKATYGAIYNYFTIQTGKICPVGWHVPVSSDWNTLTTFTGGPNDAGARLKETGNNHWESASVGATNESGFTAIPGGMRQYSGKFWMLGERIYWWGADGDWQYGDGWQVFLNYSINQSLFYHDGAYIRCIRD